jgi:ActR/RegA family two-component response regulator
MIQEIQESSNLAGDVAGCVVLIFSKDRSFLDHYREIFVSLGFVPITATTAEAALAILRLMVVAFVVVDQSSGIPESRKILEHARDAQRHGLVLVIAREANPHFRCEALALGAVEYLIHPVVPDDFVHALHLIHESVRR